MDRIKKMLKAVFFPHIAIVTVVTVLASLSLIYSLIKLPLAHHISIISYILSLYAASLVICAFPELISKTKNLSSNIKTNINKINEKRSSADPSQAAQLKINITLYGTFFYNSVYAVFTLFLGLIHRSTWYISIATYYILIAVMRFSLLYYFRSNKAGEDVISELKRFRFCGVLLIAMNTALSVMTAYITAKNQEILHRKATTVVLAIFTVSLFALSIVNIIKYRKLNSPLLFAAKLISFVSALVSMLSLETAIIGILGISMDDKTQKAVTGISAFAVLAIIGYIGAYMIITGSKKLKELEIKNQEDAQC